MIIPVYSQDNYIKDCILLVLNQNFEHNEIIVIDDVSQDIT